MSLRLSEGLGRVYDILAHSGKTRTSLCTEPWIFLLGVAKRNIFMMLSPETGFVEDSFSMDRGRGWFQDNSSTLHLLRTSFLLLLYQFHLRASDIRSRRLGTWI